MYDRHQTIYTSQGRIMEKKQIEFKHDKHFSKAVNRKRQAIRNLINILSKKQAVKRPTKSKTFYGNNHQEQRYPGLNDSTKLMSRREKP